MSLQLPQPKFKSEASSTHNNLEQNLIKLDQVYKGIRSSIAEQVVCRNAHAIEGDPDREEFKC